MVPEEAVGDMHKMSEPTLMNEKSTPERNRKERALAMTQYILNQMLELGRGSERSQFLLSKTMNLD